MTQTFEAVYDGIFFRPDKPLKIKPITRVQIQLITQGVPAETVADLASRVWRH